MSNNPKSVNYRSTDRADNAADNAAGRQDIADTAVAQSVGQAEVEYDNQAKKALETADFKE